MSQASCQALRGVFSAWPTPVLEKRKLRRREVEPRAQGHTTWECDQFVWVQSRTLSHWVVPTPDDLVPSPRRHLQAPNPLLLAPSPLLCVSRESLLFRVLLSPQPGHGLRDPEQTDQTHSFAASIVTILFPSLSLAVGADDLVKKHSQCIIPNWSCPLEVTWDGRVSLTQNRMVKLSSRLQPRKPWELVKAIQATGASEGLFRLTPLGVGDFDESLQKGVNIIQKLYHNVRLWRQCIGHRIVCR